MKSALIKQVANGFIVHQDASSDEFSGPVSLIRHEPYVFETFEKLTEWLKQGFGAERQARGGAHHS